MKGMDVGGGAAVSLRQCVCEMTKGDGFSHHIQLLWNTVGMGLTCGCGCGGDGREVSQR